MIKTGLKSKKEILSPLTIYNTRTDYISGPVENKSLKTTRKKVWCPRTNLQHAAVAAYYNTKDKV